MKEINSIIKEATKEYSERNEDIIRAFIAKYGFEPDRIVQLKYEVGHGLIVKHLDQHDYDALCLLKAENEELRETYKGLNEIVWASIDRMTTIAFDIPPTNKWTPQLLQLAEAMKSEMLKGPERKEDEG